VLPVAVGRKFSDEQGSSLGAVIAYCQSLIRIPCWSRDAGRVRVDILKRPLERDVY
jgi:hypothetical protein